MRWLLLALLVGCSGEVDPLAITTLKFPCDGSTAAQLYWDKAALEEGKPPLYVCDGEVWASIPDVEQWEDIPADVRPFVKATPTDTTSCPGGEGCSESTVVWPTCPHVEVGEKVPEGADCYNSTCGLWIAFEDREDLPRSVVIDGYLRCIAAPDCVGEQCTKIIDRKKCFSPTGTLWRCSDGAWIEEGLR